MYRQVNQLFGDAVLEEAGDRPAFVFIQDYHFALLPRYLKERNPNLIVAQFWHIPWPNRETFRVFPWKEELLEGLLGNDLLGFHLRYHCQNFLEAVDRTIEARIDQEQGRDRTRRQIDTGAALPHQHRFRAATRRWPLGRGRAGDARWAAVSSARGDIWASASNGSTTRREFPSGSRPSIAFRAIPRITASGSFVQVGVPTRGHIASYQQIDNEIDRLVEQLNWKWGTSAGGRWFTSSATFGRSR